MIGCVFLPTALHLLQYQSQHREEEAEEVEEEGYVESGESERKRKAFEQLELFNVLFMHCIEKRFAAQQNICAVALG